MKTRIEIDGLMRLKIEQYLRLEKMMASNKRVHRELMGRQNFGEGSDQEDSLRLGLLTSGLFHRMAQTAQSIGELLVGSILDDRRENETELRLYVNRHTIESSDLDGNGKTTPFDVLTDHPFVELGDTPCKAAPIRKVRIVDHDNNKYATVVLPDGQTTAVKWAYLFRLVPQFLDGAI